MTYTFKSRTTGDLIMLQADGRHLLQILGKDPADAGIIRPEETAAAVQALQAAIDSDESRNAALVGADKTKTEAAPTVDEVSLRHRAAPLIDMLRRCETERTEVVWGV
jgi:hypothetical protein